MDVSWAAGIAEVAMPIDRYLWKAYMTEHHVPEWPCPGCDYPTLKIARFSLRTALDRDSIHLQEEPHHPTMLKGVFVCLLACEKCKETLGVSGKFVTGTDFGGNPERECRPKYITPPPRMIKPPWHCPDPVYAEINAAFSLYWNDLASCLNRIRNALELVLDDLKVPKFSVKNGKRHRLNLHHRIVKLEAKRPWAKEICERMMAVKHLGNAGSHPGVKVEVNDVFDGFDILERVLVDVYSDQPGELARAVRQINQRKGPRRPGR